MSRPPLGRFYREAIAAPADRAFTVLLDGKALRTPKGSPVHLPTRALAEAIADEWTAQGERIEPAQMPMTKLANTALDGVRLHRAQVLADLDRYAGSDLLCYRASEPEALQARQAAAFDPILAWAEATLGARLAVTSGIVPIDQPASARTALADAAQGFDDFSLTALHTATTLLGSLVLGLALAAGRIDAGEAWQQATLDEIFQAERWGVDAEAEARLTARGRALEDAARFLALVRS